ncbi:sodium- and chloride-dependent glycine transporter 1-like [Eupeodes corollae]|uniref:sodium- and chloride-dependent glycine transporter 1-like n=1 Tax=Eupeodes corollae TaxID=290404 RepID=UPI00248F8027|nr:sodium- and chloride-dependent glycine transporter 1-like [Eupeodes corollae]
MTSADNHRHVSSYDIGAKPFRHDPERGKWSSRLDFYFACLCQGFGWEALGEIPVYIFFMGGGFSIISFLLSVLFVGIPIFFIQSFLGQFSSTGLISAFRIVPLFKGIGFLIVIFNAISLTYYSVFAAVPLYYFIESIQPNLPWMNCNQSWNSPNCTVRNFYDFNDEAVDPHATVEFFHSKVRGLEGDRGPFSITVGLLFSTLAVWLIVSLVFFQKIKLIGTLFRITAVILFAAFLVVFLRLFCLSGFQEALKGFSFEIPEVHLMHPHVGAYLVMLFFRPGWANVVNLASHNSFQTDIMKMSFMVCLSGFGMIVLAATGGRIVWDHFEDHVGGLHLHVDEQHSLQFIYLCYAFLLGELPYANLWCAMFFGALCLVEVIKIVTLLMTVQTALCDEFEILRSHSRVIKATLVGFLVTTSIFFCTQSGFHSLGIFDLGAVFSQTLVFFLILVVVLWIYGKMRFQRDAQFMVGRTMSTWAIFVLQYVAPFVLCVPMFIVVVQLSDFDKVLVVLGYLIQSLPWMVVIIYIMFALSKSRRRSLAAKLRECIQPSDWYPANPADCRRYEQAIGLPDHAHQLLEMHLDMDP